MSGVGLTGLNWSSIIKQDFLSLPARATCSLIYWWWLLTPARRRTPFSERSERGLPQEIHLFDDGRCRNRGCSSAHAEVAWFLPHNGDHTSCIVLNKLHWSFCRRCAALIWNACSHIAGERIGGHQYWAGLTPSTLTVKLTRGISRFGRHVGTYQ